MHVSRFALVAALATIAFAEPLRIHTVSDDTLKRRINLLSKDEKQRAEITQSEFERAGCTGDNIAMQKVRGSKTPNIICTLPGTSGRLVVVGAHHDASRRGDGAIDNWTGNSLLPSLYESMKRDARKHTFVFVSFAAEEKGMYGSKEYVKQLGADGAANVQAMVGIDSIGLGPTKIWVSRSDPRLVALTSAVAQAVKADVAGMNVDGAGDSDTHAFADKKIPVLDIHSVTRQTIGVLHSPMDRLDRIDFASYKETYSLAVAILSYLDGHFEREAN